MNTCQNDWLQLCSNREQCSHWNDSKYNWAHHLAGTMCTCHACWTDYNRQVTKACRPNLCS